MSVSFLHAGDARWASYRYRAARPAAWLGASMNRPDADVLVFAKPMPEDVAIAQRAKADGRMVVVDFCDPHFSRPEYVTLAALADVTTCSTQVMRDLVCGYTATAPLVIPDPYEYIERPPHCHHTHLFWFGHGSNLGSVQRIRPTLAGYPLTVMSNVLGTVPWSLDGCRSALWVHDIVVMPKTAAYKSANRTVEAIRQGCFVVAEPHPSLDGFPIWIGNIREGVDWAIAHRDEANAMTASAQDWIRDRFSMETCGTCWEHATRQGILA